MAWPQQNSTKPQELAKWIMGIVVAKAQENEKIKRSHITYDKKVIKYNFEINPPKIMETSIYQIYGQNGQSFEKLVQRNGQPVRNARPEIGMADFNSILLERYNFNLNREELIDGRWYYVIDFRPREPIDKLPLKNRLDEGINRTAGYLYIDMEKYYLKQMKGHLIASFGKGLNIFEMQDFTFLFEQEIFEGVVVPSSIVLTYKYRVFWGETREKLEYTYSNRRKN